MLEKSPLFSEYFDEKGMSSSNLPFLSLVLKRLNSKFDLVVGNWTLSEAPIPDTSLEDFVTVIPPGEEKEQFLGFIRKMLAWDPEARAVTNEIFMDEWLHRPFEGMW